MSKPALFKTSSITFSFAIGLACAAAHSTSQQGQSTNGANRSDNNDCKAPIELQGEEYAGLLPSMQLGSGVQSLSGSVVDRCIRADDIPPFSKTTFSRRFRMKFVQEADELKRALSIDAAASFELGVYSAEASARFFQSEELNSESAYLVLDVEATLPPITLTTAALTDRALEKLRHHPDEFLAQCGDQYVSSISQGGIFIAVYRFSGLGAKSKQELAISLSASGGNWTASGDFRKSLSTVTSRYRTELFVLQQGGTFSKVNLTPEELIREASEFGGTKLTQENAYPVRASTRSYYTVNNWPGGARYSQTTEQLRAISAVSADYDRARVFRNDLRLRLQNRPGRLNEPKCQFDRQVFESKLEETEKYIAAVEAKARHCRSASGCGAPTKCLETVPVPSFEPPRLTQDCGPRCTDGIDSDYEFDAFGYCTRCIWKGQSKRTSFNNSAQPAFEATCKYLRRGANVLVRATGKFSHRTSENHGAWLHVKLEAASEPEKFECNDVREACAEYLVDTEEGKTPDAPTSFDLRANVNVGQGTVDSSVVGSLFQVHCQKHDGTHASHRGCAYSDVKLEICDTDATDCGAPMVLRSSKQVK